MAEMHRAPAPRVAARRGKSEPVFCVGWKAFVHWPANGAPAGRVPLTDLHGNPQDNDLVDGQQVEILSWRPRSSAGVLYQIRRLADGSEWWIGARHLRLQAVPVATAPVVTTA